MKGGVKRACETRGPYIRLPRPLEIASAPDNRPLVVEESVRISRVIAQCRGPRGTIYRFRRPGVI